MNRVAVQLCHDLIKYSKDLIVYTFHRIMLKNIGVIMLLRKSRCIVFGYWIIDWHLDNNKLTH